MIDVPSLSYDSFGDGIQNKRADQKKYKSWNQSYLDEFLSLKCCGDILNVVSPIQRAKKEISESMAIIKRLRRIVLRRPMEYILYDLCAGTALTSILSVHLLPVKHSYAIDIRKRTRDWYKVKRFSYYEKTDIREPNFDKQIAKDSIMVSVHPCTELADRIIEIFEKSLAKYLILMPCCVGKIDITPPQFVREKIGSYLIWCWDLASKCSRFSESVKINIDKKCLSPKNCIITAKKNV